MGSTKIGVHEHVFEPELKGLMCCIAIAGLKGKKEVKLLLLYILASLLFVMKQK